MSDRLVTKAIKDALKARFSGSEWALFFEVAQSTGGAAGRTADAVAMNMFPSRGLAVHGVEVKASRADWLRELKDPSKSEPVQRFCDHWWIAANAGIVNREELPPTWGLLELQGKALRQKVAAPKLKADLMDRGFMAALLRNAAGRATRELQTAIDDSLKSERASMRERIDEAVRREVESRSRDYSRLKKSIEDFEQASGIDISGWKGGRDLGHCAKLVESLGVHSIYSMVSTMANNARKFVETADEVLPQLVQQEEGFK